MGPTRSDEKSESLIDHIWSTESFAITSGKVAGISDHSGIYAVLPDVEIPPRNIPVVGRSYKTYDKNKAQSDFTCTLNSSDFEHQIREKNVNIASKILNEVILSVCDSNAPVKEFKNRKKSQPAPWFTPELSELINRKEQALCEHQSLRTGTSKNVLKTLRTLCITD